MKQRFYKIPLDFRDLFNTDSSTQDDHTKQQRRLKTTNSLKKSIDEHIELIIMTHLGENRNEPDYGFVLWDIEFENIEVDKFNTHNNPKEDIEIRLNAALQKFEPRLKNIKANILFMPNKKFKEKKIKFFVNVAVRGQHANLIEEPYSKSFSFAMGPLY